MEVSTQLWFLNTTRCRRASQNKCDVAVKHNSRGNCACKRAPAALVLQNIYRKSFNYLLQSQLNRSPGRLFFFFKVEYLPHCFYTEKTASGIYLRCDGSGSGQGVGTGGQTDRGTAH